MMWLRPEKGDVLEDVAMNLIGLQKSVFVTGTLEGNRRGWDADWRMRLVINLEDVVTDLWDAGIEHIVLGGEFVTKIGHPDGIEGYFLADETTLAQGDLEKRLNQGHGGHHWSWAAADRVLVDGKRRSSIWANRRVEFYPHTTLSGLEERDDLPSIMRSNVESSLTNRLIRLVQS